MSDVGELATIGAQFGLGYDHLHQFIANPNAFAPVPGSPQADVVGRRPTSCHLTRHGREASSTAVAHRVLSVEAVRRPRPPCLLCAQALDAIAQGSCGSDAIASGQGRGAADGTQVAVRPFSEAARHAVLTSPSASVDVPPPPGALS